MLEEQTLVTPQAEELGYAVRAEPGKSWVEHVSESERADLIEGALFAPRVTRLQRELAQVAGLFSGEPKRRTPTPQRKPRSSSRR